ncbi:MAG: hypothetical protein IJU51_08950 [Clostridia bacterium]|nr:hypothetical protein [Ruminococcus sp.]MBQ9462021.1 hypothetical protein [Clostridia bacterium]
MRKRKITTALATAALCLTVAAAPAGGCIQRSCTGGTCVTVSTSDKCCTKKSSCKKGKCSGKKSACKTLADLLKQYTCKTCK